MRGLLLFSLFCAADAIFTLMGVPQDQPLGHKLYAVFETCRAGATHAAETLFGYETVHGTDQKGQYQPISQENPDEPGGQHMARPLANAQADALRGSDGTVSTESEHETQQYWSSTVSPYGNVAYGLSLWPHD